MNTIVVTGRCVREPEVLYEDEKVMVSFTIADNGHNGREKTVNFHRCVAYGSRAERLGNILGKGVGISVSGRLNKSKYTGKDGVTREQCDILVNDFTFTDRKDSVPTPEVPEVK